MCVVKRSEAILYRVFKVEKIMTNLIKNIAQNTTSAKRKIRTEGKNLIVVGNNGAGKTKFLRALNSSLSQTFISQQITITSDIKNNIKLNQEALKHYQVDSQDYNNVIGSIEYYEAILSSKNNFDVVFFSTTEFIKALKKNEMILRFFEANRSYHSNGQNLLTSIDSLYERFKSSLSNEQSTSNYFESYLVSMSNYALLEKGAGDRKEYDRVAAIIKSIELDLKNLFEDKSLILDFNRKKLRMEIIQKGKDPFGFDTLPAGFASILAIYAELIMLSELSKQDKNKVKGIVLIDEIDAHLHVTLQKKVFNFFSGSFPNIQFVISTHSPFVVQSVSDAIIYNLSKNEQMEDLSLYSYASIVKGLLGESTNSDELEDLLAELNSLAKKIEFGNRFLEIIEILENNLNVLDPRAKAMYLGAKSRFVDWSEENGNV